MVIISILFISVSFVYSPIRPVIYFPRIVCYESFSKPKLYLPLHIHSYTGPQFIKILFDLDVQKEKYITPQIKYFNQTIYFKKIDGICEYSNIRFASDFSNIYKLFIVIKIFLVTETIELSFTSYSFEKGFQSDKYMLIDEFGNFAISATVTDSKKRSPPEVVGDEHEAFMYLKTLKYEGNYICFVTNNNRNNVIKPYFHNENKEKDYIISISVKVKSGKHYPIYRLYQYPAFECDFPKEYDQKTYFIFEKDEQLYFVANTIMVYRDNIIWRQKESFSTNKTNNKLTEQMLYNRDVNFVFLMKEEYIAYENNTKRKIYKSKNGTVFYSHYGSYIQVKPKVKRIEWIGYDPWNLWE